MNHDKPSVMDRRAFLRTATAAAIGLGVAGAASPALAARGAGGPKGRVVPRGNISVQLYSLRGILPRGDASSIEMVMQSLFDFGYRKVEPYNDHGLGWDGLRAILDRVGLRASSMHNGDRNPESAVAASLALGTRFTNFPFFRTNSLDAWYALFDDLNTVGAAMQDAGVRYGYHQHDYEFTYQPEGVSIYDRLLEATDPKLVHMQLDLYWAVAGGADPLEVFQRAPGRFLQFHVKDRLNGTFADPGEGEIDFPAIFGGHKDSGVIEYITENDRPADPLEFAQTGYDYLRGVRF